jgi:hypothetical protein
MSEVGTVLGEGWQLIRTECVELTIMLLDTHFMDFEKSKERMFSFFKYNLEVHHGCISKLRVLYFLPQNSFANRNKHLTARERPKEGDWNFRCGGVINEGDAYRVLVVKPEGKRPFGRRKCIWEYNIDFVSL